MADCKLPLLRGIQLYQLMLLFKTTAGIVGHMRRKRGKGGSVFRGNQNKAPSKSHRVIRHKSHGQHCLD